MQPGSDVSAVGARRFAHPETDPRVVIDHLEHDIQEAMYLLVISRRKADELLGEKAIHLSPNLTSLNERLLSIAIAMRQARTKLLAAMTQRNHFRHTDYRRLILAVLEESEPAHMPYQRLAEALALINYHPSRSTLKRQLREMISVGLIKNYPGPLNAGYGLPRFT